MALANNQKEQMMKRLKDDYRLAASEYSLEDDQLSDGSPALKIKSGSTVHAYAAIKSKSFVGFNVVAELSSGAGEGLPEHDCYIAFDNTAISMSKAAKLVAIAKSLGAASLKIVSKAGTPAAADIVDTAVTDELGNTARYGASGA